MLGDQKFQGMSMGSENEVLLKENERIDDLERNGYRIIQDTHRFCFGMDAVLLSGFARVKNEAKVLDLGTGTGIIPILLEAKTGAAHLTSWVRSAVSVSKLSLTAINRTSKSGKIRSR